MKVGDGRAVETWGGLVAGLVGEAGELVVADAMLVAADRGCVVSDKRQVPTDEGLVLAD